MHPPFHRRAGIGRRLLLAFGVLGVLVLGCAGGGMLAVDQQRDLADEISAVDEVLRDAETARFQIADVTGWQGLVVADAAAFGADFALADDSYNRSGLLASKDGIYAWIDEVDTGSMSDAERDAFARLRPAWDNYFRWDDQVVEWLATDPANGVATALESINGGEAGEGYGIVLGIADEIQASATKRADALRAEQSRAQQTAMLLLGIAGLLAFIGASCDRSAACASPWPRWPGAT
jgi:methyl-accepting chemotaxis protein